MPTISDCLRCGLPPFPGEYLCSEGLCIECWDREAGKYYFSAGAIASRKCRDRIRDQKRAAILRTVIQAITKLAVTT